MNKIYYIILLSLYSLNLSSGILDEPCAVCTFGNLLTQQKPAKKEYIKQITAKELFKKIKDKVKNLLIINVIGKRFYDDCHIPTSISAPLKQLHEMAHLWDKTKEVIVYCACYECDASEKAYMMLKSMGFRNVTAYEGGIREWYKLGYPCCGPCAYDYLRQEGDEKKLAALQDSLLKQLRFYWGVWA